MPDHPDWSGSLVQVEIHRRKAEEALVLLRAGLSPTYTEPLREQAKEHLECMLSHLIDAIAWLRSQP